MSRWRASVHADQRGGPDGAPANTVSSDRREPLRRLICGGVVDLLDLVARKRNVRVTLERFELERFDEEARRPILRTPIPSRGSVRAAAIDLEWHPNRPATASHPTTIRLETRNGREPMQ